MLLLLALLIPLIGLAYCHPHHLDDLIHAPGKCGYPSCPTPIPGKLNVHLVPHSHDDVGWLKTVDQYYYGSATHYQNAGVQYILDSVVQELMHDPKKKFIYVETAFFWKWWLEQGDHMKHQVKNLVANGQLEFIGGAWSMNDEATTHYQSVIDQFTWGFRKLNDTFGYCGQPKIGWQIDPFGHARETASLMAQMGFDGLFFGRLDYQDKRARLRNKTMEMIWEGSDSLGSEGDIFTGVLYNLYQAPLGFCFDIMCGDEPMIDDKNSRDYNIEKRVNQFINFINKQRLGYATENIVVTMGGDFNYQDAHYYYKNLEKLIRYVNERQKNGSDINVFYSTPSCYVKSLNEANIYWPTKKDDFFPYASDQHSYWTGYFTSRPTLKYFERIGNNYLQICKQLSAVAHLGWDYDLHVSVMREAMGIMQHHDAITGTEKQHVAQDYARILSEAFGKCGAVINEGVNRLLGQGLKNPERLELKSCLLSNVSECSISSESKNFTVIVYNPLSRPVNYFVRLPVFESAFSVRNPKGNRVECQLVPIPLPLKRMPGRTSQTEHELVFKAESVPPLGYRSYFISKLNRFEELENLENVATEVPVTDEATEIYLNATEDGEISIATDSTSIKLKTSIHYYIGEIGSNSKPDRRSSGAYIFRPKGSEAIELKNLGNDTFHQGKIVAELHQEYTNWTSHVIRQYAGEPYVEVEWMVGPIPINDRDGKEVVWRYATPEINNNGRFFTDSSGRETLERVKDFRPTWDLEVFEPISGNYYPVTTDISINNGDKELTVIVDRAQGGTSLKNGEIELMVHRRLLHDDAFGVGESLNETAFGEGVVARGRHWILAGSKSDPEWARRKRHLQQQKILDSHVFLTNADSMDFESWSKSHQLEFSGLRNGLPSNVQILTLEHWSGSRFLLRLEHIFQKNETQEEVSVDLDNLFVTFDIVSIRETTLGANQWLDETSRLKWKKETNDVGQPEEDSVVKEKKTNSLQIKLKPKEIRTFICQIKPKMFV